MYIKSVCKNNGKTKKEYHTLHLVESYQTEKGPRQRLILNLGPLDIKREQYKELAAAIEKRLQSQNTEPSKQLSFMNCDDFNAEDTSISTHADRAYKRIIEEKQTTKQNSNIPKPLTLNKPVSSGKYTSVDLATLEAHPALSVGPEHVCHSLWKELGLEEAIMSQGITIDTARLIEIEVMGRLMQCGSERRTWQWANNESTLFELIMNGTQTVLPHGSFRSLYRACDVAYSLRANLETHLSQKEKDIFDLPEKLCLFDLTNTFFEGSANKNSKAAYGRSKEKRSDCPLLSLALLIDENGFAKYSKTFPGNVSEPSTLKEVLNSLRETRPDLFNNGTGPTVIMDKGIATEENLKYLRECGLSYIVAKRGRCEIDADRPSSIVREDKAKGSQVVVQLSLEQLHDDSGDILVNCRSINRRGKEASMRTKAEQKMLEELKSTQEGLSKKRCTKNYLKVVEKIGRLKQKYARVAKLYTISVIPQEGDVDDTTVATNITWIKKDGYDEMLTKEGSYIIRSNRKDLTEQEYWEIYMTLNNVERSFRYLKSDLGLRPCHHQNEDSTDAHIFITVLAYHVLHAIEYKLRNNGDTRTWATIKHILSTHRRLTISCATPEGAIHTRLCTTPTAEQIDIYRSLNISAAPLAKTVTKLNYKK